MKGQRPGTRKGRKPEIVKVGHKVVLACVDVLCVSKLFVVGVIDIGFKQAGR